MKMVLLHDILANALERKDVLFRIEKQHSTIWEHTIKYLMFEDEHSRYSWIKTLDNTFDNIMSLGSKSSFPNEKQVYDYLFDNWNRRGIKRINKYIRTFENEYPELKNKRTRLSNQEIYEKLHSFIKKVIPYIVKDEDIPIKELLDS